MKRLASLDFLRGLMIFIMITYHALVYCIFEGIETALAIIPDNVMPFLLPLLLLLTWAAFFALISGFAKTYKIMVAVTNAGEPLKRVLAVSLIRGGFILILHYFYLGVIGHFQRNLAGDPVRSLLVGSWERGAWALPDWEILFYTDALLMTSLSGIGMTFVLGLLGRRGGFKKEKRNIAILTISGCIIIFISPVVQNWLVPIFPSTMDSGRYGVGMVLSWLVGPRHCMFPYFAYALFGGVFGIILCKINSADSQAAESRRGKIAEIRKKIMIYGFSSGGFFLSIALIMIVFEGMPQLTTALLPFTMYVLNLGLMLVITTTTIWLIELRSSRKAGKLGKVSLFFRRFGLITLSMYLIESSLSLGLFKIFQLLSPVPMETSVWWILLYLGVNGVIWWTISIFWGKVNFRFSFEWLTDKLLWLCCHHRSDRLIVSKSLR